MLFFLDVSGGFYLVSGAGDWLAGVWGGSLNGTQLTGEEDVLEFPNLCTDYIRPQRKLRLFGAGLSLN